MITRAIELNEQLERVLKRHDALISGRPTSTSSHVYHDEEEEEAEQLFRRYACIISYNIHALELPLKLMKHCWNQKLFEVPSHLLVASHRDLFYTKRNIS